MGAWGYDIFDDDIAFDIKTTFEDSIEDGLSVAEATERVMEEYEDALDDEDDAPVIILTLAMLQLEEGEVQENTRESALDIIESGKILERWEDSDPGELLDKKKVLKQLRSKLLK